MEKALTFTLSWSLPLRRWATDTALVSSLGCRRVEANAVFTERLNRRWGVAAMRANAVFAKRPKRRWGVAAVREATCMEA